MTTHQDDPERRDRDDSTTPRGASSPDLIEGEHGQHGGSLESEGAPQEQQPESGAPADDRARGNPQRPGRRDASAAG